MNISKRQLYAMGETLGDSCTRKQAGRTIYGGGGGGSSSSNATTNNSYAFDSRMAIGEGSLGLSASGDSDIDFTVNQQDPGALRAMELSIAANTRASEEAMRAAKESAEAATKAMAQQSQAMAQSNAATTGAALSFAAQSDATNKAGFGKLLETSFDMFSLNTDVLSKAFESTAKTQELTAAAYQTATAEKAGSIDNKTIMVMAVAGAAALVMMNRR